MGKYFWEDLFPDISSANFMKVSNFFCTSSPLSAFACCKLLEFCYIAFLK